MPNEPMSESRDPEYHDIELLLETVETEDEQELAVPMNPKQIGTVVENALSHH